jgi:hypothetical protein
LLVPALAGAAMYAAGCGSGGGGFDDDAGNGADASTDGFDPFANPDGNQVNNTLDIKPPNPTLAYPSQQQQQFTAYQGGTTTVVNQVAWSIDNGFLGSIDQNGLFKASGNAGGITVVSASSGQAKGQTTATVVLTLQENPGNVSASDQTKLKAGGTADAQFKWLYPYDKTVFPRGLPGPVLQFAGATAPTAFYVKITSKFLNYEGFYSGTNPARVTFSPAVWKTISQSAAANDPVTVEVTKLAGGVATGPVKETWNIAQGSLKGTVYYNSYSSPLGGSNGATLKVKIGSQAQVLVANCSVCHSVSANGNVYVASYGHQYDAAYDLTNNTQMLSQKPDWYYSFGGLTPNGEKILSCGTLPGSWPPNIPGMQGNYDSQLFDTKTGNKITANGFDGVVKKALFPVFSPDGTKVAFGQYEVGAGHTLSVMDFAFNTNTFSNLKEVANDQTKYLGWPAFVPDDKTLIYHSDSAADFATWSGAKADLMAVDLATKQVTKLDALNGMNGSTTYLPYGPTEQTLNYEPTVLPIAVGGYYWVLFTSRRMYGNTITDPGQDATPRKKLWVAAIDINAVPGKDPSHPAFYLDGQELAAGNMRGFWALDPCKQNGISCETGDECCGGFCRPTGDGGFACVPPPTGQCSKEFEKCTTAGDCCDAGSLCVNGRCAKPPPN